MKTLRVTFCDFIDRPRQRVKSTGEPGGPGPGYGRGRPWGEHRESDDMPAWMDSDEDEENEGGTFDEEGQFKVELWL